ncbi:UDP-glucuronate decarboxylase [Fistulifera solaris]|uniref:UDP-glucuronate decarboxylase n=1 Tax=Fistulifera solaris TaxID=1519565 RepID=A0A1Z5JBG9_FISSO|nr:UDP-glucuronate decarboxylase [Fistulifera solaris]|eukprot:GAX11325.1 UDP-glucuronate decarboxylase [Fistulifera solaris]
MVRVTSLTERRHPSSSNNNVATSRSLTRRHGVVEGGRGGGGGGLWSRQSLALLGAGILVGYVVLPVLLVEMDIEKAMQSLPKLEKQSTPANPYPIAESSNPYLRADQRTLETTIAKITTEAEKRLLEDRDVLSKQSLPTSTTPYVMKTAYLPDHHRKKILVTGGSGFVGSHLVDKLMMEGHEVIVVDNFFTGQKKNIAHWLHHPNFSLIVHDVTEPIQLEVDQIYHLACPASPPHYQYNPVKTIKTSVMGTLNMLGLAKRVHARILLSSTSEIYGDPEVSPQPESYWGHVNTIGPRACYDEGKRVAETMMYSYQKQNGLDIRVARIFNTFGPRMHPNDGRVVSNFIIEALQNKDMTIYGDGKQTRSFQYVSDLVDGLHALMNNDYTQPVNLGNPSEWTIAEFAEHVQALTKSSSQIIKLPKSTDDPQQRRPDIQTAKRELDWEPKVSVDEGLKKTIEYFAAVLREAGEIIPTGPGAAKPEA